MYVTDANVTLNYCNFESNGASTDLGRTDFKGGAFYCENSDVKVNNCNFKSNYNYDSNNDQFMPQGYGGAIFADDTNLTISDSLFDSNFAYFGGAIKYGATDGILDINNTVFKSNGIKEDGYSYLGSKYGGAIAISGVKIVKINNSHFDSNYAEVAGAIYVLSADGILDMDNTEFTSNGEFEYYYYSQAGGAILIEEIKAVSINNSIFKSNKAMEGSAICYVDDDFDGVLNISYSVFEENGYKTEWETTKYGGAIVLDNVVDININYCDFKSNTGFCGGAIFYYSSYDDDAVQYNMNINNSNFIKNRGNYGGAVNINSSLPEFYVTIVNTNFDGNYPLNCTNNEEESCGGAIYSTGNNLLLNHTSFSKNGFYEALIEYLSTIEEYGGSAVYFYGYEYSFIVDCSNFTENIAKGELGGAITTFSTHFRLNNSIFAGNKLYTDEEGGSAIMCGDGDSWVDNTVFISNKVIYGDDSEDVTSVIYSWYGMNLTNCVFYENTPLNFKIEDKKIVVNSVEQGILLFDYYIPDFANVTIYLDNSDEGKNYSLVHTYEDDEEKCYVDGFTVSEDNYLIEMVVTQVEGSQCYGIEEFYNNLYIFVIPHEFKLTVDANDVKVGKNTEINGIVYFNKEDGSKAYVSNQVVELYINGTYIANTTTDKNGMYSFKYSANVIGTQNVLVKVNETFYNNGVTNSTTFNVEMYKTSLTVDANDVKIGDKTTITGQFMDDTNNPIKNSVVTLYINNNPVNVTTDDKGNFKYLYKTTMVGENHVMAVFEGNYTHSNSLNNTNFNVSKISLKITITASDTTINKDIVIKGKVTDENNNALTNVNVTILFDGNEIANVKTDNTGAYSYKYTTKNNGTFNILAIVEGDDKYTSSNNKTEINVKNEKIKTTITVVSNKVLDGESTTLKATVKDANGKFVTEGKVLFKINGKSVTDSKGNPVYLDVKNGKVTLKYTPTKGLFNKNSVITAVFAENDNYLGSKSNSGKLSVVKKEAVIKLNQKTFDVKPFSTVTVKAKVTNKDGSIIKSGKVTFKVNSKTYKTVSIKNGVATLKYKLGNKVAKTYKVTAVYSADIYKRVQKTAAVKVKKFSTTIKASDIKTNKKTFTLKASVLGEDNKAIRDSNKVTVKINGITYKKEVKVTNGKINLKLSANLKKGKHTISILSGSTSHYKESRKDIKLTVY